MPVVYKFLCENRRVCIQLCSRHVRLPLACLQGVHLHVPGSRLLYRSNLKAKESRSLKRRDSGQEALSSRSD